MTTDEQRIDAAESTSVAVAPDRLRLAVLFDVENLPAWSAAPVLTKARALGDVVVALAFGDFGRTDTEARSTACSGLGIGLRQSVDRVAGKNAADIELVIDAMDLMHAGLVDVIAVASSDTDFAPLARRVTTADLQFVGFGNHTTPDRLRDACSSFHFIEMLPSEVARYHGPLQGELRAKPSSATPLLKKAIAATADPTGWSLVEDVQNELDARYGPFDPRPYGYRRLADLLGHYSQFEVDLAHRRGDRVRRKPTRRALKRRAAKLAARGAPRPARGSQTDSPGSGSVVDPAAVQSKERNGLPDEI